MESELKKRVFLGVLPRRVSHGNCFQSFISLKLSAVQKLTPNL
jgi:hypothetical protein